MWGLRGWSTCVPLQWTHTPLLVSVAEMTEVRDKQSWGFGKEKPTSFRVLGIWSGNLEDFMEEVPFGKQSRILRDGGGGGGWMGREESA